MTRLPAENQDVKGIDYCPEFPKYKVGPLCCLPTCSKLADHAHHIWRRSFLAGDYGWVRLWDGTVVQNLCGLCYKHHSDVTENRMMLEWREDVADRRGFWWTDLRGPKELRLWIEEQPKVWACDVRDNPGAHPEVLSTTKSNVEYIMAPGSVEKCPTCQRKIAQKSEGKREAAKPREKWTITVPKDKRENGAEVLDTLLEEAAKICGHDQENDKTRYHTLAFALGMFVMHAEELTGDG